MDLDNFCECGCDKDLAGKEVVIVKGKKYIKGHEPIRKDTDDFKDYINKG